MLWTHDKIDGCHSTGQFRLASTTQVNFDLRPQHRSISTSIPNIGRFRLASTTQVSFSLHCRLYGPGVHITNDISDALYTHHNFSPRLYLPLLHMHFERTIFSGSYRYIHILRCPTPILTPVPYTLNLRCHPPIPDSPIPHCPVPYPMAHVGQQISPICLYIIVQDHGILPKC